MSAKTHNEIEHIKRCFYARCERLREIETQLYYARKQVEQSREDLRLEIEAAQENDVWESEEQKDEFSDDAWNAKCFGFWTEEAK
jgi:hypothetical protein